MVHQKYVVEIGVCAGLGEDAQLAQGALQLDEVRRRWEGSQQHGDLPGRGGVQGDIQFQPGGQSCPLGLELTCLRLEGTHLLLNVADGPGRLCRHIIGVIVEQLLFPHLRPGRQEFFLLRGVVGQNLQRLSSQIPAIPGSLQSPALRPGQADPVRVVLHRFRLRHLHATQALEPSQQLLSILPEGQQPEMLHVYDCHLRCSRPF